MLTNEEQALIDSLTEKARKIDADYAAGRMSEEKYQEVCELLNEAEAKIEAISTSKAEERNDS